MNLLPCDGKFSACFGGSLTSLNAQVGRFLFESQATAEPSVDRMAALLNSIETRSAAPQSWMPRPHLDATKRCRWVNYFAVGHSGECFSFIKDWVEKKIRRHMGRSRNRGGFGWKRWSRNWLYEDLKLFNGYRVRRATVPKALPA